MRRDLPALALVLTVGPCGSEATAPCTTDLRDAIRVTVEDAASGANLASGARGLVLDGAYADSLRVRAYGADQRPVLLGAAAEREGTYTVRLAHVGYRLWEQTGIRVEAGACHVESVELHARLEAAP